MGCILCNLTSCREFMQGPEPAIKNPFYIEPQERDQFLDGLAYDIAYCHPELVKKINEYVAKLDKWRASAGYPAK